MERVYFHEGVRTPVSYALGQYELTCVIDRIQVQLRTHYIFTGLSPSDARTDSARDLDALYRRRYPTLNTPTTTRPTSLLRRSDSCRSYRHLRLNNSLRAHDQQLATVGLRILRLRRLETRTLHQPGRVQRQRSCAPCCTCSARRFREYDRQASKYPVRVKSLRNGVPSS